MPTPHNEANKGDIAKIVLMPGDPLRAKFIADTYLEDVKQFNAVRNMFGYTGTYKGKEVSVMASGMGMPSIGIYSYELYKNYDVDLIVRLGSAGSYVKDVHVFDIVLVSEAYSESNYAYVQAGYEGHKTYPTKEVNDSIRQYAKEHRVEIKEGCIHSSDVFYREDTSDYYTGLYKDYGCIGVEMESFALFHNASVLHKKAAALLTISDSFVEDAITTSKERETSFTGMMELALEALL